MVEMSLEHIRKVYPGQIVAAIPDYNLKINDGEFTVFIGPSGSIWQVDSLANDCRT